MKGERSDSQVGGRKDSTWFVGKVVEGSRISIVVKIVLHDRVVIRTAVYCFKARILSYKRK